MIAPEDLMAPEFLDDFLPAEVGHPCLHSLGTPAPKDLSPLDGTITSPSGQKEPAKLDKAPDGSLAVEFTPKEPGQHVVDVTKDGKPIPGSPFPILAEEPGKRPKVGEPCTVAQEKPKDVNLPKDLKDLKGVVTAPSGKKSPVKCTQTPDDNLGLEFTPEEPGRHVIDVTKNGKPVEGSPFVVMVDEDKPKVGEPTTSAKPCPKDVNLPRDLKDLKGTVVAPSGKKSPVKCTETPDKELGLEFTPEEPGLHVIHVTKNGKPVDGSPFVVDVQPEEQLEPRVG